MPFDTRALASTCSSEVALDSIFFSLYFAIYRPIECRSQEINNIVVYINHVLLDLFYLFDWSFSSHSRIFHSFGDVTGERLQILTYDRHLWPLSSESSLACHTHCDTGHPFIMVIFKDPWHSHLVPSVWQWSCHYLLHRLRFVADGIWTPNLPLAGRAL